MLYYDFKNYEGFKERFGVTAHGNGSKSRKNKILLAYVKQPQLLREARETGDYRELNLSSMTALWKTVWKHFYCKSDKYSMQSSINYFNLLDTGLCSKKYKLDALKGICEDGDLHAIRYVNVEKGRVYKMKPGKFLAALIDEYGLVLPEPVRLWMCEEFTRRWETHVASTYSTDMIVPYHLVVDDDFRSIYDLHKCESSFGSCMTNKGQWTFYRDAVKAKAASLRSDEDGTILARCIIFTDVSDEDGGKWRLAERQYAAVKKFRNDSKDSLYNSLMKRLLVDELIKAGEIDGYKQVGAGCGDDRGFVANNGDSLSDKEFSIECHLEVGDTLSYQDSFGYYNEDEQTAYNYEPEEYVYGRNGEDEALKIVRNIYETEDNTVSNYDEYREDWVTGDLIRVHYRGGWIDVEDSDEGLEDFIWVESEQEYYHEGEVSRCDRCGEYFVDGNGYYSDLTEEYYCCESCLDEAEDEWRRENMYFSEYDDDWYDDEEDVTVWMSWDKYTKRYFEQTISRKSLDKFIEKEEVIECNGGWYELPYTVEKEWVARDVHQGYKWDNEKVCYVAITKRMLFCENVRVYN